MDTKKKKWKNGKRARDHECKMFIYHRRVGKQDIVADMQ